jgi:hypothetical protein
VDEAADRMETLYAEMTSAYAVAEASMLHCQSTGDQADVDKHRADRKRVLKASDAFHAEAELSVATWRARWRVGG